MFVLFQAFYCGSCQPIIKQFRTYAAQYGDRISFQILDQDQFPGIAKEYEVYRMPFTIYFQNGTRIANTVGSDKQMFRDFITKYASTT